MPPADIAQTTSDTELTKAKYQNAMNIIAQTRGQIAILSEQLIVQERECYRLEGILEYLQSMDSCNAE